ncbi:MAG: nucleotidyl transferase AbiEii/AbiGii toxin family protein [Opitutaceae bacterium]|jgi:predicted nucleotidyltransferase component of viral defense system|nr:nucleotidyl transferase AbiEii/AbiGii toxin family protein [Opitutaceae bacterium]
MSDEPKRNLPASIRQRLLNLSQKQRQPFDLVLARYGIERLLHRLSCSRYADRFLLKGAMLFVVWNQTVPRPTRDVDLLGFGSTDLDEMRSVFADLCRQETMPDGLEFSPESVRAEPIREAASYPGIRITLQARLSNARIPIQIDIGFGDVVTPGPEKIEFPSLLDFPAPRLRAYPLCTVIAEKLNALVLLGINNTRMKDFFDLWFLSRHFQVEGRLLTEAIRNTFQRRQTPLPNGTPVAFGSEFEKAKTSQWELFLKRNSLAAVPLASVQESLSRFALPALQAASTGSAFEHRWDYDSGWQ